MMQGYYIEEQKDGKGDNAQMVLIKQVKKGVSTDGAGKISGMFPLKSISGKQLPCLKVVVANGAGDHRFEVRWSNYYEQKGLNPGKFKLVHVANEQPVILYQLNDNNRKVIDRRTGKPMIDFVEMSKKFGSEPIMSDDKYPRVTGWEFGERQAYTQETADVWESGMFEVAHSQLVERFGKELADDIMLQFVENDLFASFIDEDELIAA